MALKRAGASYSALRAATRLPPVAQSTVPPGAPPVERLPVEQPPAEQPTTGQLTVGQPTAEASGAARHPTLRIDRPDPAAAGQGAPDQASDTSPLESEEKKAAAKAIYYRLRVPYPASGVCAEFDEIARAYDAETAIQTVFKRAFDAWIEGFGPETAARMDTDYPRGSKNFATSRLIGPEVVAAVEKAIDPMGIRTKTFIAERIALAAMKAYIVACDPVRERRSGVREEY